MTRPKQVPVSCHEAIGGWDPSVRCVVLDFGGVLDVRKGAGGYTTTGYEGFLALNLGPAARRLDDTFPVDPAAPEAIRALTRLGLEVLVANTQATGDDRGQSCDTHLAAAGVRGLLAGVIHAPQQSASDPAFFRQITSTSGYAPAQLCYVHQHRADIGPVLAAGLQPVLIAPPGTSPTFPGGPPDGVPVIEHLRELPGLFGGAVRRSR